MAKHPVWEADSQCSLLRSRPALQPVPVGVPGDLYIGGDVLADGYLNREELTKERFIRDPFYPAQNGRLYKTGDLARYFADGNLEFLGRADTQVKIRGFRVEAGEIEAVIGQVAGVSEVAVKAFKDGGGQNYLIAYISVDPVDRTQVEAGLAAHLSATLPEYMVPAHSVFLPALPLTPNGKIDRAALLPPETAQRSRGYERPADEIETAIAQIWSPVLGVEKVGRNDNFFELGGHSLRAAQAIAQLQDKFYVDLTLPTLFEKPTVAALADEIRRAVSGVSQTHIPRKGNISRATCFAHSTAVLVPRS